MNVELNNLEISDQEIEDIIELNIIGEIELNIYRGLILKNKKALFNTLVSQLFILVLSLIIILPLGLMFIRNYVGETGDDVTQFMIIFALACICLVLVNIYLFNQTIQIKSLAKLMESIDQYNQMIQTIKMFTLLPTINQSEVIIIEQKAQVMEALQVTKVSLINALKVEAIFRKHRNCLSKRDELLANLEHNFSHLMSFEQNQQANEYGQLLNETLQIGMNIHREVRNLQNS